MRYLLFLTIIIGGAQPATPAAAEEPSLNLLTRAVRRAVMLSHRDQAEEPVFVRHCRDAEPGCSARMQAFAQYFYIAGKRHDVDPWLLAAMALRESGLNPFATGAVGERGLLQMHPQSPWGRQNRFVRDQDFRQRCQKRTGACQQELVQQAADLLARSLRMCGGELAAALGSYNTGRCGGNTDYARKVLLERDRLRQSVGLSKLSEDRATYRPLQASVTKSRRSSSSTN